MQLHGKEFRPARNVGRYSLFRRFFLKVPGAIFGVCWGPPPRHDRRPEAEGENGRIARQAEGNGAPGMSGRSNSPKCRAKTGHEGRIARKTGGKQDGRPGGQESERKAMQPEKSAWKRDGRRDGRPRFARLIIAICSSLRSLQIARPSGGSISHDDRFATARRRCRHARANRYATADGGVGTDVTPRDGKPVRGTGGCFREA